MNFEVASNFVEEKLERSHFFSSYSIGLCVNARQFFFFLGEDIYVA